MLGEFAQVPRSVDTPRTRRSIVIALRPAVEDDVDRVADIAEDAWPGVFASIRAELGEALADLLTPDWRTEQRQAARSLVVDDQHEVVVASDAETVVGFIAYRLEPDERHIGIVEMLGVAPRDQRRGVARQLLSHAVNELRDAGARVVMVETGGDPGHLPARHLYESAGFSQLPIARYFVDVRTSTP